jgi:cell division inhibitor SepF
MNDEDDYEHERAEHVSVLQRVRSFFALQPDDEEYDEDPPAPPPPTSKRNVVAFSSREKRAGNTEVGLFAPKSFSDVTDVADALRARQVVIVNLQGADRTLLQRVVDFTSGVAYTLDGKIQKLAEGMYLVVPPGVAVNAGGIRESLGGDSSLDFMSRG